MEMILLVDDLPTNIFILQSILQNNGYRSQSCESGLEALDIIEKIRELKSQGLSMAEISTRLQMDMQAGVPGNVQELRPSIGPDDRSSTGQDSRIAIDRTVDEGYRSPGISSTAPVGGVAAQRTAGNDC